MLTIYYLGRKTLQMIGFGTLMVLHLTIGVLHALKYDQKELLYMVACDIA